MEQSGALLDLPYHFMHNFTHIFIFILLCSQKNPSHFLFAFKKIFYKVFTMACLSQNNFTRSFMEYNINSNQHTDNTNINFLKFLL